MSKSIYTHTHHIIPRHAGGSDDPSNLIELTTEQHALAHKKLFFIYGRPQDEWAYLGLSGAIGKDEIIRRMITRKGKDNGMYDKKHTDEAKRIISEKAKGHKRCIGRVLSKETKKLIGDKQRARLKENPQVHSEETKRKVSEALKGKPKSAEHIENIRKSKIGKKRTIVDGRIRYI